MAVDPVSLALGGVGAIGNIFSGKKQADAIRDAAKVQTDAARYAADVSAKATAEALAFSKAQAQNEYLNSEVARRGNYDQWAAGQRRLGTLGQMMGLGDREIPAYVAGVDPNFTGAATSTGAASTTGAPSSGATVNGFALPAGDWNNPTPAMISSVLTSTGQRDNPSYWTGAKWAELVARGKQINDPQYAVKRLLGWQAGGADRPTSGPYAGLSSGGSSASSAPSSVWRAPIPAGTTVGDYIASVIPSLQASALPMPTIRYQPGTLGAYMRV